MQHSSLTLGMKYWQLVQHGLITRFFVLLNTPFNPFFFFNSSNLPHHKKISGQPSFTFRRYTSSIIITLTVVLCCFFPNRYPSTWDISFLELNNKLYSLRNIGIPTFQNSRVVEQNLRYELPFLINPRSLSFVLVVYSNYILCLTVR